MALGLGAELFAPQLHRPGCSEDGAGWGGPQSTPVCEGWCPLSLGFGPLLLGQPYQLLLPASWKTGPWAPCSASCGGGSQSRSVYCIRSSGAGVQEAVEEAECAGLPGKPPSTQACNLQRCAAWSVEPWGEVRPLPGPGGDGVEIRSWAAGLGSSRTGLEGLSSTVET